MTSKDLIGHEEDLTFLLLPRSDGRADWMLLGSDRSDA